MKLKDLLNVMKNNQHMIQLLNAKDHGFLECVEVKELLNPQNEFNKYLECEIFDMYSEEIEGDTQLTIEIDYLEYPYFSYKNNLYCIVKINPHKHKNNLDIDTYGVAKIVGDFNDIIFVDYMFGEDEPEEMVRYAKDLIDLKRNKALFLKGELEKLIEDDYNPSAYGLEEDKEEAKSKQLLCKDILKDILELL